MTSTTYYWDEVDDNLFCEEDKKGDVTAEYQHEAGLYGELISQNRGGKTYRQHYDGTGDTRAVTDANEDVVETATYSAIGEGVEKTSSIVKRDNP